MIAKAEKYFEKHFVPIIKREQVSLGKL